MEDTDGDGLYDDIDFDPIHSATEEQLRILEFFESYSLSPGYTDSIIYINPFKTDSSQKENLKKVQEKLDKNGSVIFSAWNYNNGGIDLKYLQIHTFSGVMNTNGRIDLFNENCNMNSSTDTGSVNEITNTSDELFRVGYILK